MRTGVSLAVCVLFLALPGSGRAESPVSSHAMLHTCCTPPELKERAFAESKALGASFIRVDVEMGPIFETAGAPRQEPDWSGLDQVVELSRRYDLPVLGLVLDTPAYVGNCPERWPDAGRCAARDPAQYGRLAGELAAHARGAISHWEIVNEPDGGWAFQGSAEEYARMLAASYDAIKQRVPEARVVMGGVMAPADPGWAERFFATPGAGAAHKFDVANIHLRGRVVHLPTGVGRWRSLMGHHGFTGPLWVTEHGYSADPAFQQDPSFVGGEAAQARYFKRSLPALAEAGAEQIFVTLRDNAALEPNYVSEGLVQIEGGSVRRRPAFEAVRRFGQRWPEIRELLARQRRHERSAASLAGLARADERQLARWRRARADVRQALNGARRFLTRGRSRRLSARRRAQLAYARRVERSLRKRLRRFDVRVRSYAQRTAGNRLESMQHWLAALDCARRIED
jgi:hypothetical protein